MAHWHFCCNGLAITNKSWKLDATTRNTTHLSVLRAITGTSFRRPPPLRSVCGKTAKIHEKKTKTVNSKGELSHDEVEDGYLSLRQGVFGIRLEEAWKIHETTFVVMRAETQVQTVFRVCKVLPLFVSFRLVFMTLRNLHTSSAWKWQRRSPALVENLGVYFYSGQQQMKRI